jgi:hypothetical protein
LPLTALAALVLCLSGCGGCGQSTTGQNAPQTQAEKDAAAKKKKEEEEKDAFEIGPVTPLLSESIPAADDGRPLSLAKPGHWTATVQRMAANQEDFEGRTTVAAVDARDQPLPLPETQFAMTASRPALLAKGRAKRVQNELLPPASDKPIRVRSTLQRGGAVVGAREQDWELMPSYQYFLMVLAREPQRYAFLKVADAIRAPYEYDNGDAAPPHYRVALADGTKTAPLPVSALNWTSLAYLVWDEVNLARLDVAQQQALIDWLHWGGRLIVNGPDSLATLRGSFLDQYLPVDSGKSITIDTDDLTEFNAFWTTRTDGKKTPDGVVVTKPWSGIELTPRAHGRALPGAEGLFYEGAVGSGSIVVSAVQLAERDLVNWPGYDSFLNGGLLRRPPRRFRMDDSGFVAGLRTEWAAPAFEDRGRDAYFTTPLRWFARDARTKANAAQQGPSPDQQALLMGYGAPIPESTLAVDRASGLGGWNDLGPASTAAREALVDAAGVRVPGASFVVICLAVYLVVLVPLNWMLFQALGRVEWAWIAAPVIALAGTLGVVRQAQLDIGFVRSQTEIGLLELQGDLPRGHLSRYMALYSSLSTVYDAEFADPTAVATPFPAKPGDNAAAPLLGERTSTVAFEKYDQARLLGIPVASASTQLIHSEQMLALAGPLRLSSPSTNPHALQLENRLGFDLADAAVVRRTWRGGKAAFDACWLGEMTNGTTQLLAWQPIALDPKALPFATEREQAAKANSRKRLNVDELLQLAFRFSPASDPWYGPRDEYRLVARLDEPLPGAATSPSASQTKGATVILAHLRNDLPPAPGPDVNSASDFGPQRRNAYDEELPLDVPEN